MTARFSNGGGDPGIPDYAQEGRGLAVKFYLADGSKTDIVALSLPCFFARTPEDFLAFTRARKPDPETGEPDFEKVGAWLGEHPEAGPAIQAALSGRPARELRHGGLQLDPLLQVDGAGRNGALGALPLRAGGGRELPPAGGGEAARARLPAGGDPVARRPPRSGWSW